MNLVARAAVLLHVVYKLFCACMCVVARADLYTQVALFHPQKYNITMWYRFYSHLQ